MIKVEEIKGIVRKAIFSGYLKDEKPLSLLIAALPESGKTTVLEGFYRTDGILLVSDATAYGIIKETDDLKDIEKGDIRHIIIPDLVAPLSKRPETTKSFVAFMNALIEEGVVNINTYAVKISKRTIPARCGLITAITPEYLNDQRHGWLKMGFLSRMLPVTYSYSQSTVRSIFEYILKEEHLQQELEELDLPVRNVKVELNEKYAREIMPFVQASVFKAEGLYGFRLQRQIQTLLKASALEEGRTKVTKKDIHTAIGVLDYVNLDYRKI